MKETNTITFPNQELRKATRTVREANLSTARMEPSIKWIAVVQTKEQPIVNAVLPGAVLEPKAERKVDHATEKRVV